ncbi:CD226 antigen-like isoform X2 [Oreochromis niloticus]|uniref:CD226 antigen-like isoform X2 n=1 Tax=Oreochromis niloticus TaxID=8128 RepID=UPI00039426B3|nr:CD226 antigen-like isoform X2 [Oreochromis niloticus]
MLLSSTVTQRFKECGGISAYQEKAEKQDLRAQLRNTSITLTPPFSESIHREQLKASTHPHTPDQKNITAESGQDITLPCQAPNNKTIKGVEWIQPELQQERVLFQWEEKVIPSNQYPSFKNRVDLQDRQMKDGDVSLILKNVTINDTGTYECRVLVRGGNRRKRANLGGEPISIIYLSVVAPPGQPGGHTQDRGKEVGGVALQVFVVLLVVVSFVILLEYKKRRRRQKRPRRS